LGSLYKECAMFPHNSGIYSTTLSTMHATGIREMFKGAILKSYGWWE